MLISNTTAQLNTEKAVAEILSNFNSNFVMDVMEDSLKSRFKPYTTDGINYPMMLERDFKTSLMSNPSYTDQINEVRAQTYMEIIQMICGFYNLNYVGDPEASADQLYATATMMYDVFCCAFTGKMVHFYIQYILNNIDSLYKMIKKPDDAKSMRDGTAYGKKIYVDPKLIMVHSCMDQIMDILSGIDITMPTLMKYLVGPQQANYLCSVLEDKNDLYKYHYASYLTNPYTRPDMFTILKLNLQQVAAQRTIETPIVPNIKEVSND